MTAGQRTEDDQDVPMAGSTVSLLSLRRDVSALGELQSWSTSPSGLVVTSHITTTPEMAEVLDGERTWASTYTQQTNTLVVFEGVARQARSDRPGHLVLDGVSVLAREHRRIEPRAQVPCVVRLRVDEPGSATVRTIDLSRSGCRVDVDPSVELVVGDVASAELTLVDETVVRTDCRVLRLDEGSSQAVLQFQGLTDADMAAIERSVLTRLSADGDRLGARG